MTGKLFSYLVFEVRTAFIHQPLVISALLLQDV